MRTQWITDRTVYPDGDESVYRRFVYVEWVPAWSLRYELSRYDGMPSRIIQVGPVRIGWGHNHEWVCKDDDECAT